MRRGAGSPHAPKLRGGDRQANAALYRITLSRLRWDQPTRDYLDRRITEGKTKREARRCLKRCSASRRTPGKGKQARHLAEDCTCGREFQWPPTPP